MRGRSKQGNPVAGLLVIGAVGLVLWVGVWLYEHRTELVLLLGVSALVVVPWLSIKWLNRRTSQPSKSIDKKVASSPPEFQSRIGVERRDLAEEHHARMAATSDRPVADRMGPVVAVNSSGALTMDLPDDPPLGSCHALFRPIYSAMELNQWDAARTKLQQVAYGMADESPEVKREFTTFMKVFAARDPLLAGVLRLLMPVIRSNPGVLQSQIYKHAPGVTVEQVRYALYFAEQLSLIRRQKSGSSYKLYEAAPVIDAG